MILLYDTIVFYVLNSLIHKSAVGDLIIHFFAEYAIFFLVGIFLISIRHTYTTRKERVRMIVLSIVSVVCTHFLVMPIIHIYWQRLRPFVVLGTPHLFTVETYGFPSGHTMLSFTIATIAYFFNRRVGLGLYILGICIGMTRISGGVHYPLDVIGGAIIGTIVAVGVIYGYRFLFLLKRV